MRNNFYVIISIVNIFKLISIVILLAKIILVHPKCNRNFDAMKLKFFFHIAFKKILRISFQKWPLDIFYFTIFLNKTLLF